MYTIYVVPPAVRSFYGTKRFFSAFHRAWTLVHGTKTWQKTIFPAWLTLQLIHQALNFLFRPKSTDSALLSYKTSFLWQFLRLFARSNFRSFLFGAWINDSLIVPAKALTDLQWILNWCSLSLSLSLSLSSLQIVFVSKLRWITQEFGLVFPPCHIISAACFYGISVNCFFHPCSAIVFSIKTLTSVVPSAISSSIHFLLD